MGNKMCCESSNSALPTSGDKVQEVSEDEKHREAGTGTGTSTEAASEVKDLLKNEEEEEDAYSERLQVHIAPTITRISNINIVKESFRAHFYIVLTWRATTKDLQSHRRYRKSIRRQQKKSGADDLSTGCDDLSTERRDLLIFGCDESDDLSTGSESDEIQQQQAKPGISVPTPTKFTTKFPSALVSTCGTYWEPEWRPSVRFPNAITLHSVEWQSTCQDESEIYQLITGDMILSMIVCDIEFSEDFEQEGMPFDVQDLTLIIEGRLSRHPTKKSVYFRFSPDVHQCHRPLAKITSKFSPITDQWNLVGLVIDFFIEDKFPFLISKHSRRQEEHTSEPSKPNGPPRCVLSVKLERNWKVVIQNQFSIMFMLALVSMFVFAIDVDDYMSRLDVSLTLLLTVVMFDLHSPVKQYLTLLDSYQLSVYAFVFLIMTLNMMASLFEWEVEQQLVGFVGGVFVMLHTVFILCARYRLEWERKKIKMGYRAVQQYIKDHSPRPGFEITVKEDAKEEETYYGTEI